MTLPDSSPVHATTSRPLWTWLVVALVTIGLDQLTKYWTVVSLQYGQVIAVFPCFNLTYVLNPGAAFSFLAQAAGWQRWFFLGLALVVSLYLWRQIHQQRSRTGFCAGAAMVIGGAIGNAIDRVTIGAVVDFLDVYWGTAHWPAFNLADSAIFLGVVLMLVDELRSARAAQHSASDQSKRSAP